MEGARCIVTNYADLEYCYHNLRSAWSKLGRSVYAQGQGSHARNYDQNDGGGRWLLFGAESFWKGLMQSVLVVPGNSDAIAFENPGPIMEAKTERLEAEGKSSFMEITIPKAVIRFRQAWDA